MVICDFAGIVTTNIDLGAAPIEIGGCWADIQLVLGEMSPQRRGAIVRRLLGGRSGRFRAIRRVDALRLLVGAIAVQKKAPMQIALEPGNCRWFRRLGDRLPEVLGGLEFWAGYDPRLLVGPWSEGWGLRALDSPVSADDVRRYFALAMDYGLAQYNHDRRHQCDRVYWELCRRGAAVSRRRWRYWAQRYPLHECAALAIALNPELPEDLAFLRAPGQARRAAIAAWAIFRQPPPPNCSGQHPI